ncbi:MAG: DedA family protein [Bacteroidales bacterium]|jgi:membrane protein DedA with SNARE-associated domain
MDIIHTVVDWYMANLNYLSVMLLMTVESSFIPFPSEVVVPFAAFKAAEGELNIFLVVLFSSLGAMLGAFINYYLALWLGRPIVYKFAESKLGKICLLSREKVEYAEKYFVKHGKASTFIGRLVPAVRQLISIPAGLARMRIRDFTVYTLAGATIWNVILAVIGYFMYSMKDTIFPYLKEIMICIGVLFVVFLVYKGLKARKNSGTNPRTQD